MFCLQITEKTNQTDLNNEKNLLAHVIETFRESWRQVQIDPGVYLYTRSSGFTSLWLSQFCPGPGDQLHPQAGVSHGRKISVLTPVQRGSEHISPAFESCVLMFTCWDPCWLWAHMRTHHCWRENAIVSWLSPWGLQVCFWGKDVDSASRNLSQLQTEAVGS